MNRIDRLTAMLIHLQSKKVVKAEEMANRFEISLRTVYRDVKALMEAGVPIGSEAGKGYFVVDGYHLPPVMFTQDEAGAMLLAGKFVEKMTDKSVRAAFSSAMYKIKAVLNESEKEHLENLQAHIEVYARPRTTVPGQAEFPDHFITDIQRAVVQKHVLQLEYLSNHEEETQREVEPIGLFYYGSAWHLIAWCRLRNGYRDFRADRIKQLTNTGKLYEGRNLLTLQEYFQSMFQENQGLIRVCVIIDKIALQGRPLYGAISQTDLGDKVQAEFMSDNLNQMARWLLMFGTMVSIQEPEELKIRMAEMSEELHVHYNSVNLQS
jgi:predicted DNA-binding transcriptional regulator YafY